MKHRVIINGGLLLTALSVSIPALANQATIILQNPDKFTDIRSGNASRSTFLNSIQSAFNEELSVLAGKLPKGYKLTINVTNLDLAGEVNPVPMMNAGSEFRIMKDIYFPEMTFDYTLSNATGAVVQSQEKVRIKDMSYLIKLSSLNSNTSFYYERKMFRDWFNKTLLPTVK